MSLRAGVFSFGLMAVLAWPAGATNRLQNPYFSDELAGWTADPPEDASYDPLVGTSGGSARLRVDPVTEIRQCVSVTPAAVYDFQVSCLTELWDPFGASCDLVTQFYAGSACDGEALSIHYTSPDPEASGWRLITYRSPTPLGCHSVMMKLQGHAGMFGSGPVHFDDALVDPVVRGDLDNDDHTDLILRHSAPSIHFSIWQMSDTTRLQEWDLQPQQQDPFTPLVGVGEFNSDWYSDLVFQNSYTGVITLWRMVGPYLLGAAQTYDTLPPSNQWRVRATGRFKKWSMIGLPPKTDDLVLRNLSTNALQVWMTKDDGFGLAGVVVPSPDHAVDSNWTLVAGADFNQDGHGDFLWYNESTGKIVTWYMDEDLVKISGQFTTPDSAGGAGWRVVAAGDYGMGALAVAGTPDIVWRNSMSGKLVVWHMDAASHRTDGVFTTPDAPSQPLAWTVVGPH